MKLGLGPCWGRQRTRPVHRTVERCGTSGNRIQINTRGAQFGIGFPKLIPAGARFGIGNVSLYLSISLSLHLCLSSSLSLFISVSLHLCLSCLSSLLFIFSLSLSVFLCGRDEVSVVCGETQIWHTHNHQNGDGGRDRQKQRQTLHIFTGCFV